MSLSRIPLQTLEGAPDESRALLESIVRTSPTGQPVNMQAQMAAAPAVLSGYLSLRQATEEHGTLDPKTRSSVMAVAGAALDVPYVEAITALLAVRAGWTPDEVIRFSDGLGTMDEKLDLLLDVVADAVGNLGRVEESTWSRAVAAGWTAEQLADAFAYVAIAIYLAYFVNFAATEVDVPTMAPVRS
jgi:hypothetical protein